MSNPSSGVPAVDPSGEVRVFVVFVAGAVDGEAPHACGTTILEPAEREFLVSWQVPGNVGESATEADCGLDQGRPAVPGAGREPVLHGVFR